ncbi:MAG: TonB-dependent siderophore receptor [Novosphingobium sp.]|nr:TonB-dependent siderophore receptor [Novosphingobium sp.]
MTHPLRLFLLSTACWALPVHAAVAAEALDDDSNSRREIVVTGIAEQDTASATGLPLTLRETPQSVTVVERDRIEDFALTNVNDLLDQVVGINVERVETDRTYYNSRGFDITNFQVDGIGMPLLWGIQFGDLDTALFERVEAVRGANAIMTGVGNPSATINYVRKRPTDTLQASLSGTIGSWNKRRAEADISGPLTADGSVRARLIYAHEDRDSYLDYNHVNRNVYGALLAWDLTPDLTATFGYTRQENDADGVLWGALPLLYSSGKRIPYPVSATTSADWTYWDVTDQSAFAELAYRFANGWQAKGVFTYKRFEEMAKLLYAYGYPDEATGIGITGYAGIYPSTYNQYLGDFYASGPVTLFGREHQLAFGVSTGRSDGKEYENFSYDFPLYPDVKEWGEVQLPEFSYPGEYLAADYTDKLTRAYGAAHFNLADNLKLVAGATAIWLKSSGYSYGVDQARKDSKVSPYLGAVFDVTPNISLYASYTDIFNPQSEVDAGNRKLDPAKGTSIEAGIKSEWFGGRLYATASIFKAKQNGLAEAAGVFGVGDPGPVGNTYYKGVDTQSRGFEIELAGRITDNWTLSGGYTGLDIEDQDGNPTRTFIPTKSFKLATTYAVPELNNLKLGAQLRWQNRIRYIDSTAQYYGGVTGDVVVKQGAYAVLDLMAAVDIVEHLRAAVNVRNVTDSRYLGSIEWGQAYYAAPRNVSVTVSLSY